MNITNKIPSMRIKSRANGFASYPLLIYITYYMRKI